jgi:hypothetical protein
VFLILDYKCSIDIIANTVDMGEVFKGENMNAEGRGGGETLVIAFHDILNYLFS